MSHATIAVDAEAHVHRLYAEFAGLPVGVVTQCAANHAALVHDCWHVCPGGSWEEKALVFYELCGDYAYELLHAASTRARRQAGLVADRVWHWLGDAGPEVLDFGGGLGLASSVLCAAGKQVTYCDVDGPAARFAAWFFGLAGQPVEVLLTPSQVPGLPRRRKWDVMLVENVLEHVPTPAATIEILARAVRRGGLLLLRLPGGGAPSSSPLVRPIELPSLLAGAPALAAMELMVRSDDGCLLFRSR